MILIIAGILLVAVDLLIRVIADLYWRQSAAVITGNWYYGVGYMEHHIDVLPRMLGVISTAIFVALVMKMGKVNDKGLNTGIALLVIGGFGNLIQLVFTGYVTDWLAVGHMIYPMTYNIADVVAFIGGIIGVVNLIRLLALSFLPAPHLTSSTA